jgi:hypothetical protein
MSTERIIAVGLLSESDLGRLGSGFTRLWPIDETPCFNGLIQAIDEAVICRAAICGVADSPARARSVSARIAKYVRSCSDMRPPPLDSESFPALSVADSLDTHRQCEQLILKRGGVESADYRKWKSSAISDRAPRVARA